jgi:hypothetical protein
VQRGVKPEPVVAPRKRPREGGAAPAR